MGSLRERMLEEEHNRELNRLQANSELPLLSFTETISSRDRTITRTAAVTVLPNANHEQLMEFLKRSVRNESSDAATRGTPWIAKAAEVMPRCDSPPVGCSCDPFAPHGRGAKHCDFAETVADTNPTP
jgi:hypothetical protein